MMGQGQAAPLPHPADIAAAHGAPPHIVAALGAMHPHDAANALQQMAMAQQAQQQQAGPAGAPPPDDQPGQPDPDDGFPSTDPNALAQLIAQSIQQAQSADQQGLAGQQAQAIPPALQSPVVQQLMAARQWQQQPMRGFGEGALPPGPPPRPGT